jgi:hypothetical protein
VRSDPGSTEMAEQRRRNLEELIRDEEALLKELEEQLAVALDPKAKHRLRKDIRETRRYLETHQEELARFEQLGRAEPGDIEFVNREHELSLLHPERLRASRSPYTLISAPAGYGKSYLLQRLVSVGEAAEALRNRWSFCHVECNRRPGASIPDIFRCITRQELADARLAIDHIIRAVAERTPHGRRAALLIFDGIEGLNAETSAWLCSLLYRRACPDHRERITVRVIIAGRHVDHFWEAYERSSAQHPAPQRVELTPFDQHSIQNMIWSQARAIQVDLDDREVIQIAGEVEYLSGGHPRVIRDLVEHLADRSFLVGPICEYFTEHRTLLIQGYLSPVASELLESLDSKTREAVLVLSVFRRVNANTAQALAAAKALRSDTSEVDLLGDLHRAQLLRGPTIQEPFYRDDLMQRILALHLAYGSPESQVRYRQLNRIALNLYQEWIHNLGQSLPESHLKSTQRLLSVVEWLFHALHEADIDEDALRSGLCRHVRVLATGGATPVADLIAGQIKQDVEVAYLIRHRLGDDGVSRVCGWLQAQ